MKKTEHTWTCDGPGCLFSFITHEAGAQYWDLPPNWIEVSITEVNEDDEPSRDRCICICHTCPSDEEPHDEDECPSCQEPDWQMSVVLCPKCSEQFTKTYGIPRDLNKEK